MTVGTVAPQEINTLLGHLVRGQRPTPTQRTVVIRRNAKRLLRTRSRKTTEKKLAGIQAQVVDPVRRDIDLPALVPHLHRRVHVDRIGGESLFGSGITLHLDRDNVHHVNVVAQQVDPGGGRRFGDVPGRIRRPVVEVDAVIRGRRSVVLSAHHQANRPAIIRNPVIGGLRHIKRAGQ